MRVRRFILGVAVVLLAALVLVLWRGGRSGVVYQGRSVEAWFGRICRAEAALGGRQHLGGTPNHKAFRAMGTNALPFLVRRALDLRPTSAARSNLYRLFLNVPDWAGRGRFAPRHFAARQAGDLIQELRPPMEALLPLLEPVLMGTNRLVRSEAISLLGSATGNPEAAVPHLVRALTQPEDGSRDVHFERRRAALSLSQLGSPTAAALPAVIEVLVRPSPEPRAVSDLLEWLIVVGPQAKVAPSSIEPLLDRVDRRRQVLVALALHALQPGHPRGVETLQEAANEPRGGRGVLRDALVGYVSRVGWPDALLAELVKPLAAAEIRGWTVADSSNFAARSLEKTAPAEARRLYEEALPTESGPIAAFYLLQMDGLHRGATETLVQWSRPEVQGLPRLNALLWLGFASPSNEFAVATLEAASRRLNRPDAETAQWALEQMAEARAQAAPPVDAK